MDYAIRHLAKLWKDTLAADEEFITPADLAKAGLPDPLRQQIEILIRLQLRDSMPPPATEWADLDQEEIRAAWRDLLTSASAHIRCPVSYLPAILESALSDLLELLLQPRVTLPQRLFGRTDRLDFDLLRTAAESMPVHSHLSYALLRYMEIKGLHELTLDQCVDLIALIDGKLTQRYADEDFIELLTPLFDLYGGAADPSLMSIFFEEKGREDIAHELDQLRSSIDAAQLLDLLKGGHAMGASGGSILESFVEVDENSAARRLDEVVQEPEPAIEPATEPAPEPEPEPAPELPPPPELAPALEPALEPETEPESEPEPAPTSEPQTKSEHESPPEPDDMHEAEAVPFWKQFVSAQDDDVDDTASPAALGEWLAPARDRFIDEIFGGSEEGYELALAELSEIDTWRQAAHYIQKEIFARNMVDMYSEAAIDLTDQLQSYFQETGREG